MPVTVPKASPLVAVPETREQQTLSLLLRNRGVNVVEVPLIAIHDATDTGPIVKWLERFISQPVDLFVILTGEGLRRLLGFAERAGLQREFVAKLSEIPTLVRGPKPEKVLMGLGLKAHRKAVEPTSVGVLAELQAMELAGKHVVMQLYGDEPNLLLQNGIRDLGARLDVVAPYRYASKEDELRVMDFIKELANGHVYLLAFTTQTQYSRLLEVAVKHGLEAQLDEGLKKTVLAAVGPVVKERLEKAGYQVALMPERQFFMKPLVTEIVRYLEQITREIL